MLTPTAYGLAERFIGLREIPGPRANPFLSWCLSLTGQGETPSDEIPNCAAFVFAIAWMLSLDRPRSSRGAASRAWLEVGEIISLEDARRGSDIAIFSRGEAPQPGPEELYAPGHVGFFSSRFNEALWILGANQHDKVSIEAFPEERLLGIRRLS